jgi:hypothetical protein
VIGKKIAKYRVRRQIGSCRLLQRQSFWLYSSSFGSFPLDGAPRGETVLIIGKAKLPLLALNDDRIASLAFSRLALPNFTPLRAQFVSKRDFGVVRLTTTPTRDSQAGAAFLAAPVIADSKVVRVTKLGHRIAISKPNWIAIAKLH